MPPEPTTTNTADLILWAERVMADGRSAVADNRSALAQLRKTIASIRAGLTPRPAPPAAPAAP